VPLLFDADDGGICVRVRGTNPKRNGVGVFSLSAPVLEMRMRSVGVSENRGGKCEVGRFKGEEILVVGSDIQRSFRGGAQGHYRCAILQG
jgi:hypothetical protein